MLWNDEKASLIRQIDKAREVESYLREQVEECSDKMGIPKSTVDQLKSTIARLETENAKINAELIKTKSKLQGIESEREKQSNKLTFDLQQTKEYLYQKESEVV